MGQANESEVDCDESDNVMGHDMRIRVLPSSSSPLIFLLQDDVQGSNGNRSKIIRLISRTVSTSITDTTSHQSVTEQHPLTWQFLHPQGPQTGSQSDSLLLPCYAPPSLMVTLPDTCGRGLHMSVSAHHIRPAGECQIRGQTCKGQASSRNAPVGMASNGRGRKRWRQTPRGLLSEGGLSFDIRIFFA